ncbi:hypothetical protein [Bacillus manliponensis]|uniref:hypothetical protein n=1 Tax=Bacillus manliponensis TaxID=574376 RepID=UPI003515E501
MWHIKEEDLAEFKITSRNRLHPENVIVFMIGTITYSSLMMFFIIGGLMKFGWDFYENLFGKTIVIIELILYSLQLFFLMIYLFPKMPFKLQRIQTLVILLYAFQLGTIGFTIVILPGMTGHYINSLTPIYFVLLLLGAVVVHIIATVDTFKQASEGAFSMGEKSSSFFSSIKRKIITMSGIWTLLLLVLIYLHNGYSGKTMTLYVVLSIIMYAVAIGAAEFQLLAYCRFKFPSFNISWEEHERDRKRFAKRNKKHQQKRKSKNR